MSLIFLSTLHKFICEVQNKNAEIIGKLKSHEESFPMTGFCQSSIKAGEKEKVRKTMDSNAMTANSCGSETEKEFKKKENAPIE